MSGNEHKDGGAGGKRQDATGGATSGPYTGGPGAGTTRESGFIHASPESNVNPPGAPQSSHGSATEPIPGGTQGKADGQNRQSGMGAAAAGGNPGTADSDLSRQGGQD